MIRQPPYEVTELGWGEFDIKVTVNFLDISEERPVSIIHGLKLFGDTKKPVMSEKYDEFVFVNPTVPFYNALMSRPRYISNYFLIPYCKLLFVDIKVYHS